MGSDQAEGWLAQSLARDQSDDDVDDADEDVGDAGYLSVFRLAVCPNVAAPSRELEFGLVVVVVVTRSRISSSSSSSSSRSRSRTSSSSSHSLVVIV